MQPTPFLILLTLLLPSMSNCKIILFNCSTHPQPAILTFLNEYGRRFTSALENALQRRIDVFTDCMDVWEKAYNDKEVMCDADEIKHMNQLLDECNDKMVMKEAVHLHAYTTLFRCIFCYINGRKYADVHGQFVINTDDLMDKLNEIRDVLIVAAYVLNSLHDTAISVNAIDKTDSELCRYMQDMLKAIENVKYVSANASDTFSINVLPHVLDSLRKHYAYVCHIYDAFVAFKTITITYAHTDGRSAVFNWHGFSAITCSSGTSAQYEQNTVEYNDADGKSGNFSKDLVNGIKLVSMHAILFFVTVLLIFVILLLIICHVFK